ncbi:MAG: MFS transporter [Alphaproteobacteria bacterium]
MNAPFAARFLAARLPVHYGWVMLGCVWCAAFARQGAAVAVLSVFLRPMMGEFGWSSAEISGAASLGGLLAGFVSPLLGPVLDRRGARLILCAAVASTGAAALLLSQVGSLLQFYLLFCLARMNFAGPFDLGIYGAVNNWFVARRRLATAIANSANTTGLVVLPLLVAWATAGDGLPGAPGWRAGWVAVGLAVLAVGFVPVWLLAVRRPEDLGLAPDRFQPAGPAAAPGVPPPPEPGFTRAQALRTSAFWCLALYTAMLFPVQAGASLHQAAHLIERGLSPAAAAAAVSAFGLSTGIGSVAAGLLPRRLPAAAGLAGMAAAFLASMLLMAEAASPVAGFAAVMLLGAGFGGIMTLLTVAWADYFGRASFGAIRGVALAIQVLAQAGGPILSGLLHDLTGSYTASLHAFAGFSAVALVAAILVRRPRAPGGTAAAPAL